MYFLYFPIPLFSSFILSFVYFPLILHLGGTGGGVVRVTVGTFVHEGRVEAIGQGCVWNLNRTICIKSPAGAGGSVS